MAVRPSADPLFDMLAEVAAYGKEGDREQEEATSRTTDAMLKWVHSPDPEPDEGLQNLYPANNLTGPVRSQFSVHLAESVENGPCKVG